MAPGLTTTPSTPSRPFPLTRNLTASSRTKHPTFYLPDGTLLLSLHPHIFKIHKSLLTRHSQVLDKWIIEATDPKAMDLVQFVDGRGMSVVDLPGDVRGRVGAGDFERLMGVMYHDTPLNSQTSFPTLASLLRITSPSQFHIPTINDRAKDYLSRTYHGGPDPFAHQHPQEHLEDALELAMGFDVGAETKKALLYSVATTDYDPTGAHDPSSPPPPDPDHTSTTPHTSSLSPSTIRTLHRIHQSLISTFTPLLFTVGATSHMECTDIVADRWMERVISPALADGGVSRPLESLRRMADVDWEAEGVCKPCADEMREEWRQERGRVWNGEGRWAEWVSEIEDREQEA